MTLSLAVITRWKLGQTIPQATVPRVLVSTVQRLVEKIKLVEPEIKPMGADRVTIDMNTPEKLFDLEEAEVDWLLTFLAGGAGFDAFTMSDYGTDTNPGWLPLLEQTIKDVRATRVKGKKTGKLSVVGTVE